MDQKFNAMAVDTSAAEAELKEGKDMLVKCKRTKFSESIVQAQQGIEASDRENTVPDVLPHKVSAGKDTMTGLTNCAVQQSGHANGCTKGHVHGISLTGNEPARSRLQRICSAKRWKGPIYEVEEQGPSRGKLFRCKVTIHVDGLVNTVLECFGDPRPHKKAAQEHAAQGALWCLARYGHVK